MITNSFTCNSLTFYDFLLAHVKCNRNINYNLKAILANRFQVNANRIFFFGAGRMGLYTALKSIGIKEGDEVVVAGYTCVVVTNAIKYLGATAIYADLAHESVNPDCKSILMKITSKTKAIVVPHNFGIVFNDIAVLRNYYPETVIIEDCAHTISSKFTDGDFVGTKGDFAFFSMEYSKPITTGLGGWLFVNNEKYLNVTNDIYNSFLNPTFGTQFKLYITLFVQLITSYKALAITKRGLFKLLRVFNLLGTSPQEELSGIKPARYPIKLSKWQSAMAYCQIKHYELSTNKLLDIIQDYDKIFAKYPLIKTFKQKDSILIRYSFLLPFHRESDQGKKLVKDFASIGIQLGEWFNAVVHPKGSLQYCYQESICLNGEKLSGSLVNLPIGIHSKLSKKQIIGIDSTLKNLQDSFLNASVVNMGNNI